MKHLSATLSMIALAGGAFAQTGTPPKNAAPDIIVKGESPETSKFTRNPKVPGDYQIESHKDASQARTFVECAKPDPASLRMILEGEVNQIDTVIKQGTYVERHIGCHMHYSGMPPSTLTGSDFMNTDRDLHMQGGREGSADLSNHPNAEGLGRGLQALYDRGALIEYAFTKYAPDADLTKEQTHDDAVMERFNVRERTRNRSRWPEDLAYFKVAVCMVQAEPEIAINMLHSKPGSSQSDALGRSLLSHARTCVPGAKRIQVDPTQFRVYVDDALYRWVEAARGVASLIPES